LTQKRHFPRIKNADNEQWDVQRMVVAQLEIDLIAGLFAVCLLHRKK